MKISTMPPPNWSKIIEKFNLDFEKSGVLVTYGDTVHVAKGGMSADLRVHEQTHINQQLAYGVEAWWDRYLIDTDFRRSQELEAYKNQVSYIKKNVLNRKKREAYIEHICETMAKMYGNMITYEEAKTLLMI